MSRDSDFKDNIEYLLVKKNQIDLEEKRKYFDLFYEYLKQFISRETLEKDVEYCFENGKVIGAYLNGSLIGAVSGVYTPFFDKFHIAHLAVEEEYQGKGIGSELVDRIIPEDKGASVHLNLDNPGLEKFYENLGFEPTHTRFKKSLGKDKKPSD
ncbi:MAG: GNAT family N-acetyltransferase [Thermoplasmatota archaeon]